MAVQDGTVAAIGKIDGSATTTIDAAGKIVCPGFVDPHTHYDAQITWDRLLSSSAEHGVTTVVMGNCGVGIAPCRPAERDWLTDDLVTVEGIDKEVLTEGIKWEWETFPQYYRCRGAPRLGAQSRVSRTAHAVCAPMCSARRPTSARPRRRRRSTIAAHAATMRCRPARGASLPRPTASTSATAANRWPRASRAATNWPPTAAFSNGSSAASIELALTKRYATLADDEEELLTFLLDASGRPVTWLSLNNLVEKPGATMEILDRVAPLIRRGGIPQILTRPLLFDMNLRRPFMFTEMRGVETAVRRDVREADGDLRRRRLSQRRSRRS